MRNLVTLAATLAITFVILLAGCSARPEPNADVETSTTGDGLRTSYADPLLIKYAADHPKVAPHASRAAATTTAADVSLPGETAPAAAGTAEAEAAIDADIEAATEADAGDEG